jgi:Acetyltransferase (GNAT) family
MLELERNSPLQAAALTDFFARCGWQEPDAAAKLEWALAASEEWVVCRLDGEVVGFGRSCRLDPVKRVVFDVLVDTRFKDSGLKGEIVRLLTEHAGSLEEVSIFSRQEAYPQNSRPFLGGGAASGHLPPASSEAYLGRPSSVQPRLTQ